MSLGLGNIYLKEIISLAQLRWLGRVVRMGGGGCMRDTAEWPGKLEHRGRDPKEDPNRVTVCSEEERS